MRPTLSKVIFFIVENQFRLWFSVVGTIVLFGLFEFGVSRWLIGVNIAPNLHAALQASIVGFGAGISFWLLMLGLIERRKIVADELRRVAELNHVIRNSLELIVLSHTSDKDCKHKEMVLDCTHRIDGTLKALFPALGKELAAKEARRSYSLGNENDCAS